MGRGRKSLTSLGDIIKNLIGGGALPFNPDDANIWKVWDDVVGPDISRHAQPSWIKNGKLMVSVSDPIWLQELRFMEEDIKGKLNKKLGRDAVEKIGFKVGPGR